MNIAIGPAFVYKPAAVSDLALLDFPHALKKAKEELAELARDNDIFAAHLEIADDPMLSDTVEEFLSAGLDLKEAVNSAKEQLCEMFSAIDDEYLRARVDDVRDVCARIIAAAFSSGPSNPFSNLPEGCVVVASELFPSDTVRMDLGRIAAFVTEKGSKTSHVCLIAATHGIPVLTGVADCVSTTKDGELLIVDVPNSLFIRSPRPLQLETYHRLLDEQKQQKNLASANAFSPAKTLSGREIEVMANAGNVEDVRLAMQAGADGIGLFRTEFLYMQSKDGFPTEEEQYEAYAEAASLCNGKPLIIRTLDIGGDKSLEYFKFPCEDNPFLGCRAIRFCLSHTDVFKAQLRAILRASAVPGSDVRIMFPMICKLDEFGQARELLQQCREELISEGCQLGPAIKCGIMVETPSVVLLAREFARRSDFFSIGTNDLTQYVLAADRGNPEVSYLYDSADPAVIRAVEMVCQAASEAGIPVGMCGQAASDSSATELLLGTGLTELSVSIAAIPEVKMAVRKCS